MSLPNVQPGENQCPTGRRGRLVTDDETPRSAGDVRVLRCAAALQGVNTVRTAARGEQAILAGCGGRKGGYPSRSF